MLTDDEAVVVALGVFAARRLGLSASDESVDGALAKLHRVLPDALRRRVKALESSLSSPSSRLGACRSAATPSCCWPRRSGDDAGFQATYRSYSGDRTRRELSPHGLVVHSGRWYLAAHDHLRDDLRTFRVDRMQRMRVVAEPALAPPDSFDAVAYVEHFARTRAVAVGDRGGARPRGGRSRASRSRDAGGARRDGWRYLAPDARRFARLDGNRARRTRLRLCHSQARRASDKRSGARGAARGVGLGTPFTMSDHVAMQPWTPRCRVLGRVHIRLDMDAPASPACDVQHPPRDGRSL